METWAEVLAKRPDCVRVATLDRLWSREQLWALDLPTTRLPVAAFEWLLELPMWREAGVPFVLAPNDVLREPAAHPEHVARTNEADLRYPIHVTRWRGNRIVLDGLHRLLKAKSLRLGHVDARMVSPAARRRLLVEQ